MTSTTVIKHDELNHHSKNYCNSDDCDCSNSSSSDNYNNNNLNHDNSDGFDDDDVNDDNINDVDVDINVTGTTRKPESLLIFSIKKSLHSLRSKKHIRLFQSEFFEPAFKKRSMPMKTNRNRKPCDIAGRYFDDVLEAEVEVERCDAMLPGLKTLDREKSLTKFSQLSFSFTPGKTQ